VPWSSHATRKPLIAHAQLMRTSPTETFALRCATPSHRGNRLAHNLLRRKDPRARGYGTGLSGTAVAGRTKGLRAGVGRAFAIAAMPPATCHLRCAKRGDVSIDANRPPLDK
jgi:hypothetical protein